MRITIKCPNCGSQNEPENAFCTTCGVRLTRESPEVPTPTPKPASSKAMYCSAFPRKHIIDNPDLGFCPICGAVLTETAPEGEPSSPYGPRTCKNGHTYHDPFLTCCPECGLPFLDEEPKSPEPKPPKPEPTKPETPEPVAIPDGMYVPTDADLKPRK